MSGADLTVPGRGTVHVGDAPKPPEAPPGYRGLMVTVLPNGALGVRVDRLSLAEVAEIARRLPGMVEEMLTKEPGAEA